MFYLGAGYNETPIKRSKLPGPLRLRFLWVALYMSLFVPGEELYRVEKHVGSGAFAKVYSAKPLSVDLYADDSDDCNHLVLKVKKVILQGPHTPDGAPVGH